MSLRFVSFALLLASLVMPANAVTFDWRKAITTAPIMEDSSYSFAAVLQTLREKRSSLSHWPVNVWPQAAHVDFSPTTELLSTLVIEPSDLDSFNGPFYSALKRVVDATPSTVKTLTDLFDVLGGPDALVAALPSDYLDSEEGRQSVSQELSLLEDVSPRVVNWAFVGPSIPTPDRVYAIYNWRGRHDFIWMAIDTKSERILVADWFLALD